MDFIFTDHGTVWTIEAISDEAIELADGHFPVEEWQGVPANFTTDHRPAIALADKLIGEGWKIKLTRTVH